MRKIVVIIVTLVVSAGAAALGIMYVTGRFLFHQTVNGEDYSFQTAVEAWNNIIDQVPDFTLMIGEETYYVKDVFYADKEAAMGRQSFLSWLKREPITYEVAIYVDEEVLDNKLASLYTKGANAEIVHDEENGWMLIPENAGCDFDIKKVKEAVISNYQDKKETTFVLDPYLKVPAVTAQDLQEDFENVVWLNDFVIEYTNGVRFTGKELNQYVKNFHLDIPQEFFDELMGSIKEDYSTKGNSLIFTPTEAEESIVVDYGTFGKAVNTDKETAELLQLMEEHTSQTDRVPILSGYDVFGSTYLEVSIEKQHLWYYVDGVLQSETDIVTGRKGAHDTPTGVYYISECIPGKYLTGADYKTWVNRWMRLTNSGIGLHDAGWRSEFGEDVYTHNGSHGCINLPKKYAYALYEDAYVGMPVVIY